MKKSICNVLVAFFVGLSLALVMIPATAQALPLSIDFGSGEAGVGGLITLLSGPNATGSGIPVDILTVQGTASKDGVYETSGSFSFKDPSGNNDKAAVLSFNTETGAISIVGGVPSLSIPDDTTLLSGTFSSFTVLQPYANTLSVMGSGSDTKNVTLLTALGIDPKTQWGFFGFSITSDFNGVTGKGDAISTDITNTRVPEPSALLLLGSGLVGVLALRRKQ